MLLAFEVLKLRWLTSHCPSPEKYGQTYGSYCSTWWTRNQNTLQASQSRSSAVNIVPEKKFVNHYSLLCLAFSPRKTKCRRSTQKLTSNVETKGGILKELLPRAAQIQGAPPYTLVGIKMTVPKFRCCRGYRRQTNSSSRLGCIQCKRHVADVELERVPD